jgi:hypothetical protein
MRGGSLGSSSRSTSKITSEHHYDKKMSEFFELKLGNMTMEKYDFFFGATEICWLYERGEGDDTKIPKWVSCIL